MISEATKATLQQLLQRQSTYKPSAAVLDKLAGVDFTCFVGATCMGKTTLMDGLVALDSSVYGKSRNFVTRPPRADDDLNRYYYYEYTDKGLRPILDRIASGELLQYNINPFNLLVYGSEVNGYPHRYNLGDIFASSIDGFRQLGFGTLRVFTVVAEAETWRERFETRFSADHPQKQARIQEAVSSLEWSLAQNSSNHAWIFDQDGDLQNAVQRADLAIRRGTMPDANEAIHAAQGCLQEARAILT
ncbi:MAG: hypothetical protein WAQ24_00040 [Candidatus Saccharimonadales bacterium]